MSSATHFPPLNAEPVAIRRALLSVSDKTDLTDLARALHAGGVRLYSTGGTRQALETAGIPVTDVAELTGFPEVLDGRVKTLHPAVHAAILARTTHAPDAETLRALSLEPFELVVVNLYPFSSTIAQAGTTTEKAVEFIDIGGPTMVRAAAKNFSHVCILTDPAQYAAFLQEWTETGRISAATRKSRAADAFRHTATYDAAVSDWFDSEAGEGTPTRFGLSLPRYEVTRYGENPQQQAAVYGRPDRYFTCLHGKQLSYNNYLDLEAAVQLAAEFKDDAPACVIIKHTNPCGVATGTTLREAYERAFSTDSISPFGGIIAVNRMLDLDAARAMDSLFTELIIAPGFSDDALELLMRKANRRLIHLHRWPEPEAWQVRSTLGGLLVQQPDTVRIEAGDLKVVTRRAPTEAEIRDLLFAWRVVKHGKSNAIVFAKDGRTLGIGVGQTSRVDSTQLAVWKSGQFGLSLAETAVASEAFFPFSDGVEAAAGAGATCVIQPGGSVRDEDVIATADRLGLAMVFTGIRHFRH